MIEAALIAIALTAVSMLLILIYEIWR